MHNNWCDVYRWTSLHPSEGAKDFIGEIGMNTTNTLKFWATNIGQELGVMCVTQKIYSMNMHQILLMDWTKWYAILSFSSLYACGIWLFNRYQFFQEYLSMLSDFLLFCLFLINSGKVTKCCHMEICEMVGYFKGYSSLKRFWMLSFVITDKPQAHPGPLLPERLALTFVKLSTLSKLTHWSPWKVQDTWSLILCSVVPFQDHIYSSRGQTWGGGRRHLKQLCLPPRTN